MKVPRCARLKSENGFYHICVRGNNKQAIFQDDRDREEYLIRLSQYKERYKMRIFAYCLMTNHVHLLIYDNGQDISKFMQGLSLSYVIYFNKRYNRTGHLFQDRFTSVLVKGNVQLLVTSRYIHLNPVKAEMVKKVGEYKWSSYEAYLNGRDEFNIVDTHFLSEIISNNVEAGKREYIKFISNQDDYREDGEIATTIEEVGEGKCKLDSIKRLKYEEIHEILYNRWQIRNKEKGTYSEFRCKSIVIYLLGLISRLSWAQIAINLNISVATVYRKVKEISYRMIKNRVFCSEVDKMIFNI